MIPDTIVAIVPDESLPQLLSQVHRYGLGHTARVLRPLRSPLQHQLRRAGVPVERAPARLEDAECVLVIMAASRNRIAADLALRHGASATWIVSRDGSWDLIDDHILNEAPRGHAVERVAPTPAVVGEVSSDAADLI